jgi:hypothetical protein
MSTIMIRDLAQSRDLDRRAMCAVRGAGSLADLNVNVGVNVVELLNINVNALNNIGVIGASFPFNLKVSAKQWAAPKVVIPA